MTNPFDIIEQRLSSIESLLQNLKTPQPITSKYLTPVQLSELVNWKLTTVYQNHHNGTIPGAKKIGGKLLFDAEIINDWITDNAIPTRAERVKILERKASEKRAGKRESINGNKKPSNLHLSKINHTKIK